MKPDIVAKTWISWGISDLYFGFDTDDPIFSDYALFFEIMGLEKFLKAVHLYNCGAEYKDLSDPEAKAYVDRIAITLGHDIKKIIKKVKDDIGIAKIERVKKANFDGYKGSDLIRVVNAAYIESRYPIPNAIYKTFPLKRKGFYLNPLSSSGITKFIYALCNLSYRRLAEHINFSDVLDCFKKKFGQRESFPRFNNLFWE